MVTLIAFLKEILQAFLIIAVPILTKYIIDFVIAKRNHVIVATETSQLIKEKEQKDLLISVINRASDIVEKAVIKTNQTYVDALKNSESFDKISQKEAFNKTFDAVKELLTEETSNAIEEIYGNVDSYISMLIENFVRQEKKKLPENQ